MLLYTDILKDENPILREKSQVVPLPMSADDIAVINKINKYLTDCDDDSIVQEYELRPGVGLAAPQIGILKRMFVIYATDENGILHHYGVINPKIISHSEEMTYLPNGEGCLSVERTIEGFVHRRKRIKAKTQLFDFSTGTTSQTELKLSGYLSIVFQHEYDHLAGILFYDHIHKDNPFYIPDNSTPVSLKQENEEL